MYFKITLDLQKSSKCNAEVPIYPCPILIVYNLHYYGMFVMTKESTLYISVN